MAPKFSSRASVIAARFSADFDNVDPAAKEIAARLVQLVALFEQENRALFEYHQISRGIFSALVCLRLAGEPYELRHRELVDRMLLTSGGVTNLCHRLEKLGMLSRHRESDDGRGVVFQLTAEGVALADDLLPKQHLLERQLVDVLDESERKQLCALLEKLSQPFDHLR